MEYMVEMQNPETGIVETYNAEIENPDLLEGWLQGFRELGFKILSCREIIGKGHSESKIWG